MITIRKMTVADVATVAAIEQEASFEPWSAQLFEDCIKVGYSCWVIDNDQEVIGFGLFSCAVAEAHILNVVIAKPWRHQGLGRRLMQHLLKMIREAGAEVVYLEVRQSNINAQTLYQELKFIAIGIRKGYYPAPDGREDALTLALSLV